MKKKKIYKKVSLKVTGGYAKFVNFELFGVRLFVTNWWDSEEKTCQFVCL